VSISLGEKCLTQASSDGVSCQTFGGSNFRRQWEKCGDATAGKTEVAAMRLIMCDKSNVMVSVITKGQDSENKGSGTARTHLLFSQVSERDTF